MSAESNMFGVQIIMKDCIIRSFWCDFQPNLYMVFALGSPDTLKYAPRGSLKMNSENEAKMTFKETRVSNPLCFFDTIFSKKQTIFQNVFWRSASISPL